MKQPKSKWQNFLSFNQHKKRFGADKVAQDVVNIEINQLKSTIISGESPHFTYGSDKDINKHISNLRDEFIGQPELNYYHAKLIVLIRREFQTDKHFAEFEQLWNNEADFLCQNLSTRWLISACDTFIDYSEDATLKALLMNAVILINTIKLQESERFLTDTQNAQVDEHRKQSLQTERLALFDGVAGFAVGTDDTLRNMRWRLDKLTQMHPLGCIVNEIFDRVQLQDANTVYSRFRQWHTRDKTAWWKY